jgi:hypothetical protein
MEYKQEKTDPSVLQMNNLTSWEAGAASSHNFLIERD